MNFLERAKIAVEEKLQQAAASGRFPVVCGVCDFCGEYEYEGSDMYLCEHKGALTPNPEELPLVVETNEPPVWCPKRNGLAGVMVQVSQKLKLPGLRNNGGR